MQSPPPTIRANNSLRRLWAPICGLGLTQLIGWGTSFTALAVLGAPIGRDLYMSRAQVFGGISVMLLVSAVLAPRLGRRIDRDGARDLMVPGTLVGSIALLVLGVAQGQWSYWFGWAIFGVAVAMMLTNAAVPALVQIAGADARRAISALTIITGVTSAIFLPLTAWLDARLGWRATMLIFSLVFVVVCLPIHLAVLPHARPHRTVNDGSGDDSVSWDGLLPEAWKRTGFWLVSLWMALQGLAVWGFGVQVIDILQGAGLTHAAAIGVWIFSGPSQAVARIADFASGGRGGVMRLALIAAASAPLGFATIFAFGLSVPSATVLAVAFGVGQGLYAVARNLVPLRLFGLRTYGATMGLIALPLNIASAAAPLIFSVLIERAGAAPALWLAASAGVLSFAAMAVLSLLARRVERDPRVE